MVEAISLSRNRHQIRQKRSRHILRPDNERRNIESRSINGVPEPGIEKSPAWATQNPTNADHFVNDVAGSPPETPHGTWYIGFAFGECFIQTINPGS
jgi:hypothetical protein